MAASTPSADVPLISPATRSTRLDARFANTPLTARLPPARRRKTDESDLAGRSSNRVAWFIRTPRERKMP